MERRVVDEGWKIRVERSGRKLSLVPPFACFHTLAERSFPPLIKVEPSVLLAKDKTISV